MSTTPKAQEQPPEHTTRNPFKNEQRDGGTQ